MAARHIDLICAMCKNRGIGMNKKLPWDLPKEMAYFTHITTKTENPEKMNAVIMGRKTYESIPKKYFPLQKRINIVLSTTMTEAAEGSYLAQSLKEAISLTSNDQFKDKVEKLFVIGGYSAYKEVIASDYPCRIYLTKINADFECDTFFPEFKAEEFPEVIGLPDVPSEEQEEKGINWTYHAYERRKKEMAYFTHITTKTENPEKMNAVIMGRKTYESIPKKYFPLQKRINIVLSTTMTEAAEGSYLAQSLKEAISLTSNDQFKDKVEKLFVIGGYSAYKEVIASDYPCRIYLTKINADFECDTFFPEFKAEEFPEVIGLPDVPSEEQEEKGINWTYHAYERRK